MLKRQHKLWPFVFQKLELFLGFSGIFESHIRTLLTTALRSGIPLHRDLVCQRPIDSDLFLQAAAEVLRETDDPMLKNPEFRSCNFSSLYILDLHEQTDVWQQN